VNELPEERWVTLAILGKTRGNRGELTAVGFSKPERYPGLKEVFLFAPGAATGVQREVESVWQHGERLIFKFAGVDSITDAERLVGSEVRLPFAERPEPEPGEFYQSDLVGCEVVEAGGNVLGRVTGWQDGGGPQLLVVGRNDADGELLIPFARSICVRIDPAARKIVVDLPEGLKDLNRS
jgi:16S rRNA processing protein RimM